MHGIRLSFLHFQTHSVDIFLYIFNHRISSTGILKEVLALFQTNNDYVSVWNAWKNLQETYKRSKNTLSYKHLSYTCFFILHHVPKGSWILFSATSPLFSGLCIFFVLKVESLYPNWVQPGEWKYILWKFFVNILCACVHDVHIKDGDNISIKKNWTSRRCDDDGYKRKFSYRTRIKAMKVSNENRRKK